MLSSSSPSLGFLSCLEVGTTSAGSSGRVPSDSGPKEGQMDEEWIGRWIVEWKDSRLRGTCVLYFIGHDAHVH